MFGDKMLVLLAVCFGGIILHKYHPMRINPKGLGHPGGDMPGTAANGHLAVCNIRDNYQKRLQVCQAVGFTFPEVIDTQPAFSASQAKRTPKTFPIENIIVNQHAVFNLSALHHHKE